MSIRRWNETRSHYFASNLDKFEDPSLIDADYSWISVHVSKID
jgi:hypothetical protein